MSRQLISQALQSQTVSARILLQIVLTQGNGPSTILRLAEQDFVLENPEFTWPAQIPPYGTQQDQWSAGILEIGGVNGGPYYGKILGMSQKFSKKLGNATVGQGDPLPSQTIAVECADPDGYLLRTLEDYCFEPSPLPNPPIAIVQGSLNAIATLFVHVDGAQTYPYFIGTVIGKPFREEKAGCPTVTFKMADFFTAVTTSFQNVETLTHENYPNLEKQYDKKIMPLIIGELNSAGVTDSGYVELIALNTNPAVLGQEYGTRWGVAGHKCLGITNVYYQDQTKGSKAWVALNPEMLDGRVGTSAWVPDALYPIDAWGRQRGTFEYQVQPILAYPGVINADDPLFFTAEHYPFPPPPIRYILPPDASAQLFPQPILCTITFNKKRQIIITLGFPTPYPADNQDVTTKFLQDDNLSYFNTIPQWPSEGYVPFRQTREILIALFDMGTAGVGDENGFFIPLTEEAFRVKSITGDYTVEMYDDEQNTLGTLAAEPLSLGCLIYYGGFTSQNSLRADVLGAVDPVNGALITNPAKAIEWILFNFTSMPNLFGPTLAQLTNPSVFNSEAQFFGPNTFQAVQAVYSKWRCKIGGIVTDLSSPAQVIRTICRDFNLRLYHGEWVPNFGNGTALPTPMATVEMEILNVPSTTQFPNQGFNHYGAGPPFPLLLGCQWILTDVNDTGEDSLSGDTEDQKAVNHLFWTYGSNLGASDRSAAGYGDLWNVAVMNRFRQQELQAKIDFEWILDDLTAFKMADLLIWRFSSPLKRLSFKTGYNQLLHAPTDIALLLHYWYTGKGLLKQAILYLEELSLDEKDFSVTLNFVDMTPLWGRAAVLGDETVCPETYQGLVAGYPYSLFCYLASGNGLDNNNVPACPPGFFPGFPQEEGMVLIPG